MENKLIKDILEDSKCGVREMTIIRFSKEAMIAADQVFYEYNDPGEYQGFLKGVAWTILSNENRNSPTA